MSLRVLFVALLGEDLMMVASTNIIYIAIYCKNRNYIEAAASNIGIKIHQLFLD